jgi:ketosteroid isomerase-like protein
MNEQENINLVEQCYAAFLRGDIQSLLTRFTEDIDWELPLIEEAPFSGKRHGHQQVQEFFQSLDSMQEAKQFEPKEFIAQGNKVVVLGHYAWEIKSTKAQFDSDWTHIFTIRDGKIARFREFLDSHNAEAAYRSLHAGIAERESKEGQSLRH